MIRKLVIPCGLGLLLAIATGCLSAGPRPSVAQLRYRAVFDLGCPDPELVVYHVDARAKAVAGCGRRAVYVVSCQPVHGRHACTWMLNSPTFAQLQWPCTYPQHASAPRATAAPPGAVSTARTAAPEPAAGTPSPPTTATGRPYATDLYGTSFFIIRGPNRSTPPTELFDEY